MDLQKLLQHEHEETTLLQFLIWGDKMESGFPNRRKIKIIRSGVSGRGWCLPRLEPRLFWYGYISFFFPTLFYFICCVLFISIKLLYTLISFKSQKEVAPCLVHSLYVWSWIAGRRRGWNAGQLLEALYLHIKRFGFQSCGCLFPMKLVWSSFIQEGDTVANLLAKMATYSL